MIEHTRLRHRRRRRPEEKPAVQPESLVDMILTPEAAVVRNRITLSFLEPTGRRAVAIFLDSEDYEKTCDSYGDTMTRLLMGSLPTFVRELGGQVIGARLFEPHTGHVLNPRQSTVKIEGRTRAVLLEGYLFILLPEERVVVSVETVDMGINRIEARSSKNSAGFLARWKAFARQHNHLRGQAFFADGEILERQRAYSWDDIMLPAGVRRAIETHVEGFLRNRARLRALGVKPRRGLILEGPPGTGKTLLGKVLADTLEASFLWVSPRHIDSPPAFAHILEVARFVAPTVLFLEDLDLFAEDRDMRSTMALGELMNQLDGAVDNEDIITIATTNRLEVVEKALRNRPGRFDRILRLDALDEACRRRLLEKLLLRATISKDDLEHLVSATKDYTGAQLEELTNTLYILAVERCGDGPADGDGAPPPVPIDRALINEAIGEFRVELGAHVGFHAA